MAAREEKSTNDGVPCPHCVAGEASVWDSVFQHYAHPDTEHEGKLKFCWTPWTPREVSP